MILKSNSGIGGMVDAPGWGSGEHKFMRVQISCPAPYKVKTLLKSKEIIFRFNNINN